MLRMLSSAGRASPLHGGGHGSESLSIHHLCELIFCVKIWVVSEVVKRGRL